MDDAASYDGNMLAGALTDVFVAEITTAVGGCRGCGTRSPVATLKVYAPGPGLVGRCPACGQVTIRIVHTPNAVWLDLSGVSVLQIPVPNDQAH